jgi:hypothetical protein
MNKITPSEAKELNQNFVKTRGKAIDGAIGKKDAVSTWFSLDALKEYIAFVEKEGKSKGITVSGLRVYFGAYSTKVADVSKKNLSTVFFVPTQAKIGSQQKDGIGDPGDNSDIGDIEALNRGVLGNPPSATYPQ